MHFRAKAEGLVNLLKNEVKLTPILLLQHGPLNILWQLQVTPQTTGNRCHPVLGPNDNHTPTCAKGRTSRLILAASALSVSSKS